MKKYLFGIFAIILAIGFSAFSTNDNSTQTDYYWFQTDLTYTNSGLRTVEEREGDTGCDGDGAICEKGFLNTQLNVPNTPSAGIQSSEVDNYEPIKFD